MNYKITKKDLPKKKKIKKNIQIPSFVWFGVIILSIGILMYSVIRASIWLKYSNATKKQIAAIYEVLDIKEVAETQDKKIEVVNPPEENEIPASDPYYDYIKLPLISVNFEDLKAQNKDTVAFIKVNGTNINYPVVQTTDNSFYLNHSFDKNYNSAGWVFLDYRNDINNLNDNTIIYAHSMLNNTMFGSLKNILNNNWFQETDNYVINISTPNYNTLWQVFSVYSIPTETYYLTSNFGTIKSHQEFIDTISSRSVFDFKTTANTNDKILTLSTCKNDNKKVVLHAKLIKMQER